MLDKVWIIPLIPFISFWLILFFGKRLGDKVTQSMGIGALLVVFGLSVVTGAQWMQRAEDAEAGETVPVEIETDGESYECEGVVVSHGAEEEEHADESGETSAEEEADLETGTGEELETEAEAEAHDSEYPPCDTVDLADTLAGDGHSTDDTATTEGEGEHAAGTELAAVAAEAEGGHGEEGTAVR